MQRSPRPTTRPAWPAAADASAGPAVSVSDGSVTVAADASRRQKRGRVGGVAQRTPAAPATAESDEDSEEEQCIAFEGDEGLDVSFPLKAVEKLFRCPLCNGYFRDAVTIKECLHTFCRWCLYDYVEGGETEEVCCPYCERNMQMMTPHRDGEDSRHYMPRITAACVAGAGSVVSLNSNSSGTSAAAAANAAVLFDRTMQNLVDKLFPHFAQQERLEEEELQRFMQQHQHKQLPPEYLVGGLSSSGTLRREVLPHKRARLEARAVTEEAGGPHHLEPPLPPGLQQPQQQQQQQTDDVSRGEVRKEQREGLRSSSAASRNQQQQQLQQSLDEFVDQLLGSPTCFDEQQTTAIALLPDTYQGQLMEARVQYQGFQLSHTPPEGSQIGVGGAQESEDLLVLPLKLPHIDRPYLRVPSRMTVQLVLRYLASQLQPLLSLGGPSGKRRDGTSSYLGGGVCNERVGESSIPSDDPLDLEMALELTLEGRVLGRSHSIDFGFQRSCKNGLMVSGDCFLSVCGSTTSQPLKFVVE
ncbi:LOW QUALITY PROTEIN: zinc finger (C3HC4 RING finger) protein, putative [Eimeria mitis]|uniref:Zinc finger (C3HC4 RING finger) protein, putative n=1 Tax=Eimeria mitis TaxID=44415 RepID=U6KLS9_9EIME|nr:LOW QUALITY PROTEIN: zinc finger (C3HC4 RING finger) protein, putative [Eimeria mitis]CDJ36393.1 zinc finger (C3HC4 RING finger) protein, putative [Eimeria mitis]